MHIFVQLISKLAFCHNQPCIECVPGVHSPDINLESWLSVRGTAQSHLVPRLKMSDVVIYLHYPIYASKACIGTTSFFEP